MPHTTPDPLDTLGALIDRVIRQLGSIIPSPLPAPRLAAPERLAPAPAELDALPNAALARWIDSTLLRPDATAAAVEQLCDDALRGRFAAVCVNPDHVTQCIRRLQGSGIKVATVVGFPLGATTARIKALEAAECIAMGADELDMVINIGRLKNGEWAAVRDDMAAVVGAAAGAGVKVIIEAGFLTDEEKVAACLLARAAGVDFVKTSTGLTAGGATEYDVRLMRRVVGDGAGVKAAGGIRDAATARAMLAAGASRLGTSHAVGIVNCP